MIDWFLWNVLKISYVIEKTTSFPFKILYPVYTWQKLSRLHHKAVFDFNFGCRLHWKLTKSWIRLQSRAIWSRLKLRRPLYFNLRVIIHFAVFLITTNIIHVASNLWQIAEKSSQQTISNKIQRFVRSRKRPDKSRFGVLWPILETCYRLFFQCKFFKIDWEIDWYSWWSILTYQVLEGKNNQIGFGNLICTPKEKLQ